MRARRLREGLAAGSGNRASVLVEDGVLAGAVAGLVAGAPSTFVAHATGGDPLEASRAAGTLLLPYERRPGVLLASGAVAHAALSLVWGVVLAGLLPARDTAAWGAVAGAGIAALDLGWARKRRPRIAALAVAPQLADHVAFGFVAGAMLARRRGRKA